MENTVITSESIGNALKVLPNPSTVLASKSATIAIYHKVAKQGDILSRSQNYKDAVCGMSLSSSDQWFQEYLDSKDINTKELIRWAITARDYGFAVIEIIEYKVFKGKTVPSKFKLCKPEHFVIGTQNELRYIGSKQSIEGIDITAEHPNKFIWIKNEASSTNPYGLSLLDTAYWFAVGLNGNFEAIIQFAEDDGADKWLGKHKPDAGETEKQELLESIFRLKSNGAAVIPEGSSVEAMKYTGRGSTSDLYKTIDEMLLRKIENLWYGTDLMMQTEGKGGYSSSQTGLNIREDALEQGADLVIECFNQINQFIASINNSNSLEIDLTMKSPRSISKEEAEVDKLYFDMGLKPTTKFFTNRGYKEEEFTISIDSATVKKNAQFKAKADELDNLFEIYRNPK